MSPMELSSPTPHGPIGAQTFVLKQILTSTPIPIDVTSLGVVSQDILFIPWENGLKARTPLRGRGWEKDEVLTGPSVAKGGRATALPKLHRNLCRFQTSLCLLRLERGVDPHIAPQKAGSSLSPENSLLQITALWPFHSSPFSKSWGPGAGGAGGSGGPGLEANRGSRAKGTDWEPGGSDAVTEGTTGCAQRHGEGGPLTPGPGAHPLTTSPPQSAESLCLRRWPSGQCSGPRRCDLPPFQPCCHPCPAAGRWAR